jgi:AraC-like DNA-binding protein
MSPSTFRQHFRALTGVSPLQYQKQLRLQEARQHGETSDGRVSVEAKKVRARKMIRDLHISSFS